MKVSGQGEVEVICDKRAQENFVGDGYIYYLQCSGFTGVYICQTCPTKKLITFLTLGYFIQLEIGRAHV